MTSSTYYPPNLEAYVRNKVRFVNDKQGLFLATSQTSTLRSAATGAPPFLLLFDGGCYLLAALVHWRVTKKFHSLYITKNFALRTSPVVVQW